MGFSNCSGQFSCDKVLCLDSFCLKQSIKKIPITIQDSFQEFEYKQLFPLSGYLIILSHTYTNLKRIWRVGAMECMVIKEWQEDKNPHVRYVRMLRGRRGGGSVYRVLLYRYSIQNVYKFKNNQSNEELTAPFTQAYLFFKIQIIVAKLPVYIAILRLLNVFLIVDTMCLFV